MPGYPLGTDRDAGFIAQLVTAKFQPTLYLSQPKRRGRTAEQVRLEGHDTVVQPTGVDFDIPAWDRQDQLHTLSREEPEEANFGVGQISRQGVGGILTEAQQGEVSNRFDGHGLMESKGWLSGPETASLTLPAAQPGREGFLKLSRGHRRNIEVPRADVNRARSRLADPPRRPGTLMK